MAKLTLSDVTNPNNQTSIAATINANNAVVETALENTLSRDGTSPNEMEANLDMDSNRILNLPEPVDDTEPVRLVDLEDLLGESGAVNLDDLLDVTITSAADNDFLRYDSGTSMWVNETAAGAGNAPDSADYLVKTATGSLSAERVVTDNTAITWDWSTAGQAKAVRAALTGDVTASANSNATTIADDAVTYAKIQDVSATDRLLGRDTAGAGVVEELTVGGGLSFTGSSGIQTTAFTGDVTKSTGGTALTIANDAVTLAKMADIATSRVIGRVTASTGDPEALTGTQVGGLIAIDNLSDVTITSGTSGDLLQYNGSAWVNTAVGSFGAPSTADYLVKTTNAGLSAERTVGDSTSIVADWATPGTVTFTRAALTGDVTASSNSNSTTIANDAVTYAKMQNVSSADRLLGRGNGGGSGDVQEISLGTGLSLSTTTLNATSTGSGTFPVTFVIACSDETTALTAGTSKVKFRMPHAMTVTAVRASLSTTQTGDGAGGIFTVDINETGTTILSTKLTIDNGETTSTTAATPPVISDSALADAAEISVDIDQIGDGTAKGLKVYIIGTRTV